MTEKTTYGSREIKYDLLFSDRKTMEIAVEPDTSVLVKAPHNTPIEVIETKIKKRARWIIKQQRFFEQFLPRTPCRRYVGGESHLYLGRTYRLKLVNSPDKGIKLQGGYLLASGPERGDPLRIERELTDWYRQRAKECFNERLRHLVTLFPKKYLVEEPELQVRRMRSRWGSMAPSGRLTLNLDLIKAPIECIDYVIAHELCHIHFPDHSRQFYSLMEEVMPDFRKSKNKLEITLS